MSREFKFSKTDKDYLESILAEPTQALSELDQLDGLKESIAPDIPADIVLAITQFLTSGQCPEASTLALNAVRGALEHSEELENLNVQGGDQSGNVDLLTASFNNRIKYYRKALARSFFVNIPLDNAPEWTVRDALDHILSVMERKANEPRSSHLLWGQHKSCETDVD